MVWQGLDVDADWQLAAQEVVQAECGGKRSRPSQWLCSQLLALQQCELTHTGQRTNFLPRPRVTFASPTMVACSLATVCSLNILWEIAVLFPTTSGLTKVAEEPVSTSAEQLIPPMVTGV